MFCHSSDNVTQALWSASFHALCLFCVCCQILEALARNDEQLLQTCSRLSSSTELIPEDLQTKFRAMCGERLEHINRRITNYRKVSEHVRLDAGSYQGRKMCSKFC